MCLFISIFQFLKGHPQAYQIYEMIQLKVATLIGMTGRVTDFAKN